MMTEYKNGYRMQCFRCKQEKVVHPSSRFGQYHCKPCEKDARAFDKEFRRLQAEAQRRAK